jgi:transcriptional regulator with XRE-family HTH domain
MDFPEKLRRLMRAHGYTQASLGNKLGVSQRAVSKWLAGDSSPGSQIAMKLADEFSLNVEVLMEADHDLPPGALFGTRTRAVIHEIEPGTTWGDLPKNQRASLTGAIFADSPEARALLLEFSKLAPAVARALEILHTLQQPPPKK